MNLESFDEAFRYAERLRSYVPALYNEARERERPIPPARFQNDDENNDTNDELVENEQNYYSNQEEEEVDAKPDIFPAVQLDIADEAAFENLFCEENQYEVEDEINQSVHDTEPNHEKSHESIANESALNSSVVNVQSEIDVHDSACESKQTVKYDDDVEYTFTSVEDFRPATEFHIKAHDILCNNRPFYQNVRRIL